jgi:hypothetical protein
MGQKMSPRDNMSNQKNPNLKTSGFNSQYKAVLKNREKQIKKK